ncbi:MAG: hypothetical protein KBF88_16090 [Polyangiaceae bacterium]|nr:hypothetical protein [Polyangiaceae bacterium]
MNRFLASLGIVGIFGMSFALACVDTQGDLDAYYDRSLPNRTREAGASDVQLGDSGAFGGTYFVTCMPFLVVGNTDQSLRFKANVTSTETEISMTLQILTAKTVKPSDTAGAVFPTPAVKGAISEGKFLLDFGTTPTFPATANPITGTDVFVEGLKVNGLLTNPPAQFCATLDGTVRPSGTVVDPAKSACLFQKIENETDAVSIPPFADFKCP